MADDTDARLTHHLVVPMRDTHHAPIIFFDGAPLSGGANGIVSIVLSASCSEIRPDGEVRGEAVIAAYLKCSISAAINLRAAIDNALSRASGTSQVTAQGPKARKN
jgi:hypothetical protein